MSFLQSIITTFSMYSRLPTPRIDWKPENLRYSLSFFPLVGVVIGLLLFGWLWLGNLLGFGEILFSAGLTLIPIAVTGGLHLDGYCDTMDALSSNGTLEEKRRIMKDPHTGAFAIISLSGWFLACFALCTAIPRDPRWIILLGLIQVIGRALSGLLGIRGKASKKDGLLNTFTGAAQKDLSSGILCGWLILSLGGMALIDPFAALISGVLTAFWGWRVYAMAKKEFGGMSGDIAGFTVETTSLILLAGVVLLSFMEGL